MIAVTGASVTFCRLPSRTRGFSRSFAADVVTNTMRTGKQFALVGPQRVVIAKCQPAIDDTTAKPLNNGFDGLHPVLRIFEQGCPPDRGVSRLQGIKSHGGSPFRVCRPRSRAKTHCRVRISLSIPHNGKLTAPVFENSVALRATPVKARSRWLLG